MNLVYTVLDLVNISGNWCGNLLLFYFSFIYFWRSSWLYLCCRYNALDLASHSVSLHTVRAHRLSDGYVNGFVVTLLIGNLLHAARHVFSATLWWSWKWLFFVLFEVMKHWWNEIDREKPRYSGKSCPSANLSITNPTWTDPGSKPGLRSAKPAANRLSHGSDLFFTFLSSFGAHNKLF
jgi:hypothetical protein